MVDKETGKGTYKEVMLNFLFTPKGSMGNMIAHKGKEMTSKQKSIPMKGAKNEWDLWGERMNEDDDDITTAYDKFCEDNPAIEKLLGHEK